MNQIIVSIDRDQILNFIANLAKEYSKNHRFDEGGGLNLFPLQALYSCELRCLAIFYPAKKIPKILFFNCFHK